MPFTRRHLFQVTSAGAALGSLIEAVPALGAPSEPTAQTGHAAKIVNLDDRVSWAQQLEHNVAPVVLMSTFLVAPEDVDSFLDGFKKQFAIMRRQPGLISAQLNRGIAGSCLFMNYIVWESVDHFKRGFDLPVPGTAEGVPGEHRRFRHFLSKSGHTWDVRRRRNGRGAVTAACGIP